MGENRVLIYRERLLEGSETFIRDQFDHLTRWHPVLVGMERRTTALSRDSDIILNASKAAHLQTRAFKVFRRNRRLRTALRDLKPDLVHAHFGIDGTTILPEVRKQDLPLVVSFHGYDVNVLPRANSTFARLYRHRLTNLFAESSTLITNSSFLTSQLTALGADPLKVVELPPGVTVPDKVVPVKRRRGVLCVGRLVEVKGTRDALHAYSALPREIQDAHPLSIVGDGPLRNELEHLASHLDVNVVFHGLVSPERVSDLMSQSAVFLGSAKRDASGAAESLGVVYLEAGAHGIPVVAYASGGVPSAVADGRSALLATEGHVEMLSEHLQRVLASAHLQSDMGEAGREHVSRNFDPVRLAAQLEEIYDRACSTGQTDLGHPERLNH